MEFSNGEKSTHGYNAQESIGALLDFCKQKGYVQDFDKPYRLGRTGYSNTQQFYAPFRILFKDGTEWIIFTTTSMRTDRIKGQQWDAYNLKAENASIEKVFLVYGDGIPKKEITKFQFQAQKYVTDTDYSEIDDILSQSALMRHIEKKGLAAFSAGAKKDISGRNYEDRIAHILQDSGNLSRWKGDKTCTGLHYEIYEALLSCFDIPARDVVSINATASKKEIGHLPSGGNPKTDIIVHINLHDGRNRLITISCKKSSAKIVTVHEYSADDFADVIAPEDNQLRALLHGLQVTPALAAFGEENGKNLTQALKPYLRKLEQWVLAGIGGGGNKVQTATHIVIGSDDDSIAAYTIEDYIKHLHAGGVKGHFGTVFSWTYPSKKRGQKIQLKCHLLK